MTPRTPGRKPTGRVRSASLTIRLTPDDVATLQHSYGVNPCRLVTDIAEALARASRYSDEPLDKAAARFVAATILQHKLARSLTGAPLEVVK